MNNATIIFWEAQKLAENGLIKYTGREFQGVDMDGNPVTIKETEEIHTFQMWKAMGYKVQKGQKAVAKFPIWKHTGKKQESVTDSNGNEVQYIDKGHIFMKTAAFFSRSQVEQGA